MNWGDNFGVASFPTTSQQSPAPFSRNTWPRARRWQNVLIAISIDIRQAIPRAAWTNGHPTSVDFAPNPKNRADGPWPERCSSFPAPFETDSRGDA
jgi:hypothetical protein